MWCLEKAASKIPTIFPSSPLRLANWQTRQTAAGSRQSLANSWQSTSSSKRSERARATVFRFCSAFVSRLHSLGVNVDLNSSAATSYDQQTPTVPLIANKVSLPEAAGTVPLLSLLPSDLAKVYAQPSPDLVLENPSKFGARPMLAKCSPNIPFAQADDVRIHAGLHGRAEVCQRPLRRCQRRGRNPSDHRLSMGKPVRGFKM